MQLSDIFSGIALIASGYSLWQTSLKRSELTTFVAPVIRYASPYQNSNFEAFCIPLTIANAGARTGTVLALRLTVTDPERNLSKRFYSANFGEWSVEKAQKTTSFPSRRSSSPAARAIPIRSYFIRATTKP